MSYSVGWTPSRTSNGHVQIETPAPDGCIDGHLDAAYAILQGLVPTDTTDEADYWEREVGYALDHLADAIHERRNR